MSAHQTSTTKKDVQASAHPMLDELAELISRAWAEYESKNAPSAARDVVTSVEQRAQPTRSDLEGVRAMPPSPTLAPEIGADRAYGASTQRILRRLDALIAPFADDQPASPAPQAGKLTRNR